MTTPSTTTKLAFPAFLSFSVALATLLLQLVQTRIYSVIYWNHLVYFIISVALLGFGISGTWLSFGKDNKLTQFLTLPRAATGFIISTLLSSLLIPQIGLTISSIFEIKYIAGLFATYVSAVLPYFFAGWLLGSLFRDYVKHIHALYFADLVGSALGCLIFLAAMRPFGAVVLVLISCLAIGVPFIIANRKTPGRIVGLIVSVVLVIALIPARTMINDRIVPESTKSFMHLFEDMAEGNEKLWEHSEWNPISRIDVVGHTINDAKWIFIDGDAYTGFVFNAKTPIAPYPRGDTWPALIDHRSPYFFTQDPENVLVIGTGGGVDIWEALRGGAKNVDAIEINPTTHNILHGKYKEISSEMAYRPGVQTFNEEGRSFIRRTDKKYDVIMLHGIDTFAAINAGAYVLSENYLYTVDAMKDYISHLEEDGYLCINRWYHYAETPRIFSVCLEALYEMGIENPEDHITLHGRDWGTIIVKRSPYEAEEIAEFRTYVEGAGENFKKQLGDRGAEFIFPRKDSDELSPVAKTVADYAASRKAGIQDEYLAGLAFDISPVYDDSPFFFHYERFGDLLNVRGDQTIPDWVRGHWPSFTLFALLGFTSGAVVLFMFVPLMRSGRARVPRFGTHLTYFACLGVSFIFVEIALMQRFALLLGHPSRSLALVLAGLLFFAGVGSQLAASPRINLRKVLPILVLLIIGTTFLYPLLIQIALPWPLALRGLFTICLVAPLGIVMGMPFPTGLHLAGRWGESAVPWMWGVNGGTTVLGSVVAIIFAIHLSFTTVLLVAAGGYAVAWLMFIRMTDPALEEDAA